MIAMSPFSPRSALRYAREALYIGVGAGVLAFQRVQVQRRELEKELNRRFSSDPETAEPTPG
jgi:hypothetical protein